MPEQALQFEADLSQELRQNRLLTEVDNLLAHRLPDGGFALEAEQDIATNLYTAVQEIAMPCAVSTTVQRVSYESMDDDGRRERVFRWLGRTAVEVAESGYNYHFSAAALRRVAVEVDEARHNQQTLLPGRAQVFISPRMTSADAPSDVAKQEHLHADDAVRVLTPVLNSDGEIVACSRQSLLVRDIPLDAWVALLRDPANMFGGSIAVEDESSALSVMRVFERLEVDEADLSDGPVTIVQQVLPYINDPVVRQQIERQVERFLQEQDHYRVVATEKAAEWLAFDKQLAESLATGRATYDVERFIVALQHQWSEEDVALIDRHDVGAGYAMSRQLAARLEQAKQNILNSVAAIKTDNEAVIEQMEPEIVAELRRQIAYLDRLRVAGASAAEIAAHEASLSRGIARENIRVGGGCPGDVDAGFRRNGDKAGKEGNSEKQWAWKSGICRVSACTSPRPTEVGPCSVCRNCQHAFDQGKDPTKGQQISGTVAVAAETAPPTDRIDELLRSLSKLFKSAVVAESQAHTAQPAL